MFHENKIVMLILGLGTLIFVFVNYRQLKRLPASGTLLFSFFVLFAGWLMTVLEGFFLGDVLNLLEHVFYAASSILMLVWCYQAQVAKRRAS